MTKTRTLANRRRHRNFDRLAAILNLPAVFGRHGQTHGAIELDVEGLGEAWIEFEVMARPEWHKASLRLLVAYGGRLDVPLPEYRLDVDLLRRKVWATAFRNPAGTVAAPKGRPSPDLDARLSDFLEMLAAWSVFMPLAPSGRLPERGVFVDLAA